MPIHNIKVKEYECAHCAYRWINRTNGKDGNIPLRCASCKRKNWNHGQANQIWPKGNGLRRRINGFNTLYENDSYYSAHLKYLIGWDKGLCERFLNLEPRPTIQEMEEVIYSSPLQRYNNGSDFYRMQQKVPLEGKPGFFKKDLSGLIQDPKRPEKVIYNPDPNFISDYQKLVAEEAHIRQAIMTNIFNSRAM